MTADFGSRGQRLWDSLLARDDSLEDDTNPMREVAVSAAHCADRVEVLETMCQFAEPVIEGKTGPATNPLFVETRNQAALLARLVAALRLPDAASGKRPQHRQLRGVEQPRALANGQISSLERARQARSS